MNHITQAGPGLKGKLHGTALASKDCSGDLAEPAQVPIPFIIFTNSYSLAKKLNSQV